jgi:predicted metal-dependent phosphoesterase TrpH
MSTGFVELHCHSTASDGTLTPTQVVELAKQCNLNAMSLTDHDTVAGVAEAAEAATRLNIDFIPGIEISAEYPSPGTMHILGYGVDPENPKLKRLTEELIAGRDNRNPRIVAKLNEVGVAVTMKEWEDEAKGSVLGRPHLAAILLRKGYVSSIKHALTSTSARARRRTLTRSVSRPRRPSRAFANRAASPSSRTRSSSGRATTPSSSVSSKICSTSAWPGWK